MSSPAARRLLEDHPAWKDLRPLGYECSRWLQAMTILQTRWRKGRLNPELQAFLETWMPLDTVETSIPETFDISRDESGLKAEGNLAPVAQPVWQALLHLPALRDFWIAELRASHFSHLLQMIPRAWCMDLQPLPPGTVISGLGITGWHELPSLEEGGIKLVRYSLGENKVVLSAISTITDPWRARYTLREGQIVLQDSFLL
jgi:hypothetical protein